MKTLFTKAAMAFMLTYTVTANAQWKDVSDARFAGLSSKVITNGSTTFNSIGYNVYRSNDYGNTWTQLSVYNGYSLAIINTGTALIAGGGANNLNDTVVYVSHDNGTTWAANNTITGAGAFTVNVFCQLGTEVMAGLGGSITSDAFRSADDGATFTSSGASGVHEIRSLGADASHIYAGTQYNGVYQYTNVSGTAVWVHLDTAGLPSSGGLFNNINALCVVNGKVWAAAGPGIYQLDTVLHHWTAILTEANSTTCFCIAGTTIVRGTYGAGVYVSRDNGATWLQDNTGLTDYQISSLAVSGDTLFAGAHNHVFRRSLSSISNGVASVNVPGALSVFPNPATSLLHISSTGKVSVDILGMDGKLMLHTYNKSEINIASLPAGSYMARIGMADGSTQFRKFQKL
jgi:hypothetical protein